MKQICCLVLSLTAFASEQRAESGRSPSSRAATSEPRQQAIDAARLDAKVALIERLRRLRLGPTLTVADLLSDDPRLAWRLPSALTNTRYSEPRLVGDSEFEVVAELSPVEAAQALQKLVTANYARTLVTGDAIVNLPRYNPPEVLSGRGVGGPPVPVNEAARPPGWAAKRISARGAALAARADAAAVARIDALRRLAQEIDVLEFASGETLRMLLLAHPEASAELEELLSGASEVSSRVDADGNRVVEVAIPGGQLWKIVRRFAAGGKPN